MNIFKVTSKTIRAISADVVLVSLLLVTRLSVVTYELGHGRTFDRTYLRMYVLTLLTYFLRIKTLDFF